ncbi:MAG: glycosyltransferase family 2 protein [bacterium]
MKNIANLTVLTLNQPNIVDFADARNKMLTLATTDWVLYLDTDEQISDDLSQEIKSAIKLTTFDAYSIPRLDTFLGKDLLHGENAHNRFIRLVKKGTGNWERPVHEIWVSKGRVGKLNSTILHQLPDITTFLNKINRYSSIDASYRYSLGSKSSLFKIAFYPFAKFKYNYLFRGGVLDATPGAVMAIMMSFHSFLTWTKLYLLWHKK